MGRHRPWRHIAIDLFKSMQHVKTQPRQEIQIAISIHLYSTIVIG